MKYITWSRGYLLEVRAQSFAETVAERSPTFSSVWEQMQKSIEDSVYHHGESTSEHTLSVLTSMEKLIQDLPGDRQYRLRLCALLHDIGKPESRVEKEGKISFAGHPKVSTRLAEKILSELKYPDPEKVTKVVYYHMNIMQVIETGHISSLIKEKIFTILDDLAYMTKADLMAIGKHDQALMVDEIVEKAKELYKQPRGNQEKSNEERMLPPEDFLVVLMQRVKDKNKIVDIMLNRFDYLTHDDVFAMIDAL